MANLTRNIKQISISCKNYEEMRNMYSASNNIEIFMGTNTDENIDQLFDTLLILFDTSFER